MQVNLMGTGTAAGSPGAGRTLPAEFLQMLQPTVASRTRHEQAAECCEEERRRQDDQNDAATASAAAQPSSTDQLRQAERDMAPGSTAARRDQLHSQAEQSAAQDRHGFRQVLAEATGRRAPENAPATASEPVSAVAQPATETLGADQPETVQPSLAPSATSPRNTAQAPATSPVFAEVLTGADNWARLAASVIPAPMGEAQNNTLDASGARAAASRIADAPAAAAAATGTSASGGSSARVTGGAVAAVEGVALKNTASETAPSAAAQPEAEPDGNSDANIERILRFIHTRLDKNRSVATLRLDPPELGTVKLRMDLRDHDLSLSVDAETVAARRLLAEHLDALRRNLEASGIHLEHVEIRVPAATNETRDTGLPQQPDLPPRDFGSSTRRDPEFAGADDGQQGSNAHADPTGESSPIAAVTLEPAAESLVNVLA